METVSMTKIILETKTKIERQKTISPKSIEKLKRNFLNVTGLDEDKWEIIYNFPQITSQADFNELLTVISN